MDIYQTIWFLNSGKLVEVPEQQPSKCCFIINQAVKFHFASGVWPSVSSEMGCGSQRVQCTCLQDLSLQRHPEDTYISKEEARLP